MVSQSTKEAIVEAYIDKDTPVREIVDEFGVSISTLYKALRERGSGPTRHRNIANLPVEEMANLYTDGESVKDIAKKFGVSDATVYNRLRDAGVSREGHRGKPRKEVPVEEVARRHHAGAALYELAEDYGVSDVTLSKRLKEHGYEVIRGSRMEKKPLPVERIVERYRDGEHLRQIAEDYPVSHETIRKRLIDEGVELRPRSVGNYQAEGGEQDE